MLKNLKNKKVIVNGDLELKHIIKILCWHFKHEVKQLNFTSGFVWIETNNKTGIIHWSREGFEGFHESKKKMVYYKNVIDYYINKTIE
jgi:hypothetical protein